MLCKNMNLIEKVPINVCVCVRLHMCMCVCMHSCLLQCNLIQNAFPGGIFQSHYVLGHTVDRELTRAFTVAHHHGTFFLLLELVSYLSVSPRFQK